MGVRLNARMTKTIAISCNTSWGIYNFRAGLVRELLAIGFQVVTIAPFDDYVEKLESLGCRHITISMDNKGKNPLNDYQLCRAYKKIFRTLRPEIIFNYTIKPVIYGGFAAKSLRIPYFSFITGLGTGFLRGNFLRLIVERLYKFSQVDVSAAFFLNEEDKNIFKKRGLVPSESAHLLPGEGVDLDRFSWCDLPQDSGKIRFLYLGRILADKGVREYLQAAKKIIQKFPNAHFSVVGDCNVQNSSAIHYQELEQLGMGSIFEYQPHTEDVTGKMKEAHCIVLPSYREGLPRTLLEASAMGRIVVATDVEGCREVVQNGRTGFLCAVKSVGSLQDALEKVLELPPERMLQMGHAGRKFVQENFAELTVFKIIFENLNRVIQPSSDLNSLF